MSAAGFAYYKVGYLPAQAANTAKLASQNIQTAVVQKGDISIYARGTGTLIARDEIKLGFGTSGPISELNVQIGQKVNKGDVLAVQGNRERLNAAVIADQLSALNADIALTFLNNNSSIVAAQAQLDLANANTALNTAEYNRNAQQQGNRASPLTIASAQAKMLLAKTELDLAKSEFNLVSNRPLTDPERAQAQLSLASAQQAYDISARQYAWFTGVPSKAEQEKLDAEVALAQARLIQAQRVWETVKDGPDRDKLALAELQLKSEQANLTLSQKNLEDSVIKAPMDGTILSVTAKLGDDVSNQFISMADLSQRYLTISIDGTDIDKIALDYKVEVIFDTLPNQVFTGRVIQIDPNLYTPSGERIITQAAGQITLVKGLVSLDSNTTTTIEKLPLGMTATVDIIGGQAQGVILIPAEALHKQDSGKYAVYVVENNAQVLRPVEVGLMNFSYVEIKSGLKVGEVVITSPMTTK